MKHISENTKITLTIGQLRRLVKESGNYEFEQRAFPKFLKDYGWEYSRGRLNKDLEGCGFEVTSVKINDHGWIEAELSHDGDKLAFNSETHEVTYADGSTDYGNKLRDMMGQKAYDALRSSINLLCMDWSSEKQDLADREMRFMRRHSGDREGYRHWRDRQQMYGRW